MAPEMLVLVKVLAASTGGIVLLLALILRPGPSIPWLPPAPSYTAIAIFGAAYNAIVERSLWATAFCLGLAVMFRAGRWLMKRGVPRDLVVVCGTFVVLLGSVVWVFAGTPGLEGR